MSYNPQPGYPDAIPGGAEDNALASAALTHVDYALPRLNEMFHAAGARPAPASQLAADAANATVYMAHNMAGVLFMSAEDHLRFLLNVGTKGVPLPIFALYTAVRGGLEAAAWACWLEDPSLSVSQRAARALTERLYSLIQGKRLGLIPDYDARFDRINKTAEELALSPIPRSRKDPRIVGFGERRPHITDLIAALLPNVTGTSAGIPVGEYAYRALSGRAHGVAYALLYGAAVVGSVNAHTSMARMELDVPLLLRLLKPALDLHARSVRFRVTLSGGDPEEFDRAMAQLPPYGPGLGD